MTVKELFDTAVKRLNVSRTSISEARETVLLIFENLKKWSQTDILIKSGDSVSEFLSSEVLEAVDKLNSGIPVQYLFGNAHFYGLILKVSPAVLIPRPETAQLVDIIIDDWREESDLRVLDIATGSGCIAIALARNLRFAQVDAIDISEDALSIARENSRTTKTSVNFKQADILKLPSDTDKYDIIVSNPPYIALKEAEEMESSVIDYEPSIALFVPDNNSLKFYLPIERYALKALRPGGMLYFELNPIYAEELKQQMLADGWDDVDIQRDMQGKIRFAIARR